LESLVRAKAIKYPIDSKIGHPHRTIIVGILKPLQGFLFTRSVQHRRAPPFFDVVNFYNQRFSLKLTNELKQDLVKFLKAL
jgi:hypothetical protein